MYGIVPPGASGLGVFRVGLYSIKIFFSSWALVAHTCNPSYSGGRDQEDCSLKKIQANSLQDAILKKPFIKELK
jgi:hypothetical protein